MEDPRKWMEQELRRRANDADTWLLSSSRLQASANVIWREAAQAYDDFVTNDLPGAKTDAERRLGMYTASHLLLAGYAVENAVKAIRVKQFAAAGKQAVAKNHVHIDNELDTHDTVALTAAAGVALSRPQRALLERLQQYVMWSGRYPIPKRVDTATWEVAFGDDGSRCDELLETLRNFYKSL